MNNSLKRKVSFLIYQDRYEARLKLSPQQDKPLNNQYIPLSVLLKEKSNERAN